MEPHRLQSTARRSGASRREPSAQILKEAALEIACAEAEKYAHISLATWQGLEDAGVTRSQLQATLMARRPSSSLYAAVEDQLALVAALGFMRD
jgi:hypothetical protein